MPSVQSFLSVATLASHAAAQQDVNGTGTYNRRISNGKHQFRDLIEAPGNHTFSIEEFHFFETEGYVGLYENGYWINDSLYGMTMDPSLLGRPRRDGSIVIPYRESLIQYPFSYNPTYPSVSKKWNSSIEKVWFPGASIRSRNWCFPFEIRRLYVPVPLTSCWAAAWEARVATERKDWTEGIVGSCWKIEEWEEWRRTPLSDAIREGAYWILICRRDTGWFHFL